MVNPALDQCASLSVTGVPLDATGLERLRCLLYASRGHELTEPLINHVTEIGARFMVIEEPYTDHDYTADFLSFYASAFKTYPRYATRLHFFSEDISAILDMPLGEQAAELGASSAYRGFIVVRPIAQGPVGRTMLSFPMLDDGLTVRRAARGRAKVHILGGTIEIEAAPFIQQDTRVGACAQAAIWMANRPLYDRHRCSGWHPISEINTLATTPTDPELSRALPHGSKGLAPVHITRALVGMGYQPFCDLFLIAVDDGAEDSDGQVAAGGEGTAAGASARVPPPAPSVVHYLDSGLPVILGLNPDEDAEDADDDGGDDLPRYTEGHAVTAVGYVETQGAAHGGSATYDCFVRAVIVHDDQRGPYRFMPLTVADIPHLPEDRLFRMRGRIATVDTAVSHMFVPLSSRVFLTASRVDDIVEDFLEQKLDAVSDGIEQRAAIALPALAAFRKAWGAGSLVRRTYLTTAGRYRHHLAQTALPEAIKSKAILRRLPHFIWVTELLYRDSAQDMPGGARQVVGHVVCNATSSTDHDADLLFAHWPHAIVEREVDPPPESGKDFAELVTYSRDDRPYGQRVRR